MLQAVEKAIKAWDHCHVPVVLQELRHHRLHVDPHVVPHVPMHQHGIVNVPASPAPVKIDKAFHSLAASNVFSESRQGFP